MSTTATLQFFQKAQLKFELLQFASFGVVNTRHQIGFIKRLLLNLGNKTKRSPCPDVAKKCLLLQPFNIFPLS